MRPARLGTVTVLLAACALVACSEETKRDAESAPADWYAGPPPPADRDWPDLTQKEFVEVHLPDARNAREDVEDSGTGRPRFVVNVTASGHVQFKGNTYDLSAPEAPQARAEFREFLQRLTSGHPHAPRLMLHAAREASWRQLSWLLLDALGTGIAEVQLAVRHRGAAARHAAEWRMDGTLSRVSEAPAALEVTLRRGRSASDGPPSVEVLLRDRRFGFPPDGAWDEAFLRSANGAWAELRSALPAAADATRSARLAVEDDRVPWAYVHKALDLLFDAGWRRVDLSDSGIRLDLAPVPAAPPREPFDHGLPGLGVWLLVAAFAVFGFVWSRRHARVAG